MHKAIQAKAVEEGKDNDPMVQVQIKKKLQQHASKVRLIYVYTNLPYFIIHRRKFDTLYKIDKALK